MRNQERPGSLREAADGIVRSSPWWTLALLVHVAVFGLVLPGMIVLDRPSPEVPRLASVAAAPDSPDPELVEPVVNEAIGLGGGAGGGMRGRGGFRSLRAGGGSARSAYHTESYDRIEGNVFRRVLDEDTATFSIDVDTAAYANVRRFLAAEGRLPPKDAVRIEEMLNYFRYDDRPPTAWEAHPFAYDVEIADCPWNTAHRLGRISLRAQDLAAADRPPANLVFLLDVSGSMNAANKLPLLRQAMSMLVRQLDRRDTVSIAVYAGAAGLVLPPTSGEDHPRILDAIDSLRAGGSTNAGQGIELAYRMASESFLAYGANRVILCTDGDFNVGITDRGALTRLIETMARTGVQLSVLGFGTGNLKDATMEELSNRGNGNYAYIDSLAEARKVLVDQISGTLVTVAADVKIQVFFNPARVEAYRLIGYENRLLDKQDFSDDTKDAGEIGAGHGVTALFEIVPAGTGAPGPSDEANPFLERPRASAASVSGAHFRLRLRYKQPGETASRLVESDFYDDGRSFDSASTDFRWAASVATFGMLLRDSPHKGDATWAMLEEIAASATGADRLGYRAEMLDLVRAARALSVAGGQ